MESIAIVQPASVRIREMWQLGKGCDHVRTGLEYTRGGQSEMDEDLEDQSSGYDMISLQTVPCHIAGMLGLSC